MIPIPDFEIQYPDKLVRADRLHARLLKEVFRDEGFNHWRRRIPEHFQRSATQKYGYARRTSRIGRLSYYAWKQRKFGSNMDLVKTGRTRDAMVSMAQITAGGTASTKGRKAPGINVTIRLRFPFKGGTGRQRQAETRSGVTIEQMRKEIAAITSDEMREINTSILRNYVRKVNTETTSRQRIKI